MKTQVLALVVLLGQIVLACAEHQLRRFREVQGLLKSDSRPVVSLASTKKAEDQLLHFLETERSLEKDASSLPPYEDFMPACLEHTENLVHSVDDSYSDMQLRKVLEDECERDKEFISAEDGFNDHKACMKFAKELTAARNKELKSGSDKGYKAFCERYYVHKGGEKPKKKEKKEKKKKAKKETEEEEEEKEEEKVKKKARKEEEEGEEKVAELKEDVEQKAEKEEESFAPAAAPVASPMAAPGPSPGFSPSAAPAEAASIKEDEEEEESLSKCDAVYEAEYEKQMDKGKSKEKAKKAAKAAKKKCLGKKEKKKASKKAKKPNVWELQWWAFAVIIFGVILFAIVGAIVHTKNR